jgi:hypothetical protein
VLLERRFLPGRSCVTELLLACARSAASLVTLVAGLIALLVGVVTLVAGLIALLVGVVTLVAGLIALYVGAIPFILNPPQIVFECEYLLGRGHAVALAEQFLDPCCQGQLTAGIPTMPPV